MSGAGRKSGYRKGVTDSFLNDYPLPEEGISQIVKVKGVRGSNQIEIIDANGQESLALLPNKFRKLIWVKRNDYVMVGIGVDKSNNIDNDNDNETEDNNSDDNINSISNNSKTSNIQYMIENILGKDQIKYIKQKKLWPDAFDANYKNSKNNIALSTLKSTTEDIGNVFNNMDLNSNRHDNSNSNSNINGGIMKSRIDDLMPDYDSADECYEDDLQLNQKLDKFGNTIDDDDDDDDDESAKGEEVIIK